VQLREAILLLHLAKETVDVLGSPSLLPRLAQGEIAPEMAAVLPQLRADFHKLQIEHSAILAAIKHLVTAARKEGKTNQTRFSEGLLFRAWLDEFNVLPAAVLIRHHLKSNFNPLCSLVRIERMRF